MGHGNCHPYEFIWSYIINLNYLQTVHAPLWSQNISFVSSYHIRLLHLIPKGIPQDQTDIVAITVAGDMLWVGTNGGYLFGFRVMSCDLIVMRRQHLAIEDMVLLNNRQQMVTFGKSNLLQGVSDENNGSFMVWELYPHPENNTTK